MPVAVDTSGRVYDDFNRLLFLYAHREASALVNELPEVSDQFRFLRATCLANLKGSVGLMLGKASVRRISICRLGLLFLYHVSFVRDVLFHFQFLPSFSFLHVLSKGHMLSVFFAVVFLIIV
jgi:hypothetical protein